MSNGRRRRGGNATHRAEGYRHPEASALLRSDIGLQAQFLLLAREMLHPSGSIFDGGSPARTLSPSAEAMIESAEDRSVAIVFGPENGAES